MLIFQLIEIDGAVITDILLLASLLIGLQKSLIASFIQYLSLKLARSLFRKEIFECRISDVNYHIRNRVSVYFAKFCSHIKKIIKKIMRKEISKFAYLM